MARPVLNVNAFPHPFRPDAELRASLFVGLTPGEVLDEIDWPEGRDRYTRFFVDGVEILRPEWDHVTLTGGRVDVRLIPAGGSSGKQMLGLVAMIGLALAAGPLSVAILGAGSAGTLAATALAAGITIVGALALSALFKPPLPSLGIADTPSQQYSILAQSNQLTPYGVIPRVYGRLRIFPRVAVVPYSVNLSGANYLHAVYDFGYGPLLIEDIRIGSTPLADYQGVSYVVHENWIAGDPLTLVNGDQVSEGVAVTLDHQGQTGTRTTAADATQAVIDLTFPAGLYAVNTSNGSIGTLGAAFNLLINGAVPSASGARIVNMQGSRGGLEFLFGNVGGPGWDWDGLFGVSSIKNATPFSISVWVEFQTPGARDITVTRGTTYEQPSYIEKATWWQFRTVKTTAPLAIKVPHTILEVRVRANDQLSGTIDTLSAIATSKLATWNGSVWSAPVPTRNPAWIFADVLRGSANNRPVADAGIDLPELLLWSQDCAAATPNDPGVPQYCCDLVVDWRATVREVLQTVAACGRAALNMRDGRFSVIRDADPGAAVQIITKRNSWGFNASIPYLDRAHALNVTFFDETSWTENTIPVYADGYNLSNASLFEELKLPGIVRHNQAWRFGRYYLAQALLRRERASVTMDAEGLIPQRGDLIGIAHDTMKVGGFPSRIVEIIGTQVRVDEPIQFGAANAARVRRSDQRGLSAVIAATVVDVVTVDLADVTGFAPGDIIILGTTDVIVGDYIVEGVRPGANFNTFTIDVLENRPEVRDADKGPIPARVPKPGLNPDGTLASPAPLVPLVTYTVKDGARVYDIALNWNRSPLAGLYRVMIQDADGAWRELGTTKDTRFQYSVPAGNVTPGPLTFGVQAFSANGAGSEIASAVVTLDPAADPWPNPPAPTGLTVQTRPDEIEIRWNAVAYDFIDLYVVRIGPDWDTATEEYRNKTLVQFIPPHLAGTYNVMVKTVDQAGRLSDLAAGPVPFTVVNPLAVTIIANTVTNTAYLRYGSLALGNPGWTAQTTHRIAYYEIAKAKQTAAPPLRRLTPPEHILANPARLRAVSLPDPPPGTQRVAKDPPVWPDYDPPTGVGRSSTEFVVLSEQVEGNWRYGVRAVDVAGNMAPWAYVDLLLTPPDNFFQLDHVDDIIPLSVLVDALGIDADAEFTYHDGAAAEDHIMAFDTAQTWEGHFTANAWATPQAQVDAGFPLFAQPPSAQGSITFEHDYGQVIPQVRLTLQAARDVLAPTPVVRGLVNIKTLPGDPWTLAFNGLQGSVPPNVRFVQAIVYVEPGADGEGMAIMRAVDYTLDVHYVTDQGMDPVAIGGTFVPFHVDYNVVVNVVTSGASPGVAYTNFVIAPDKSGLTLYAFDATGAPMAGSVSWTSRGY